MVASDDKMRATKVLADKRMEDGFTRPSIAHCCWIHCKKDAILWIIMLEQHCVAAHPHISRNIVRFGLANKWIEEESIDNFECRLLNVFMRPVHWVTCLE